MERQLVDRAQCSTATDAAGERQGQPVGKADRVPPRTGAQHGGCAGPAAGHDGRLIGRPLHAGGLRLLPPAPAGQRAGHQGRQHQRQNRSSASPRIQEVNWRGNKIPKGVKLWPIGTDTAKAEIYGRLRVVAPGPGYVHLSRHLPADEVEQLTSERMVTRYVRGRPRQEWVLPPGKRNEGLDCAVYALAGAHWAGVDRWSDADWARRERMVRPRDVVKEPAPVRPAPPPQRPSIAKSEWSSRL